MDRHAPGSPVHRAPMWSRDDEVDRDAAVAWALRLGVVGVGGRLDTVPSSLGEATDLVRRAHGDRVADRLARFATVDAGSFVWTRPSDVGFRVGRIVGPWMPESSTDAARHDLQHVRRCHWWEGEVAPPDVPADVLETFRRGGRNFQRVRSRSAEQATARWWQQRHEDGARA